MSPFFLPNHIVTMKLQLRLISLGLFKLESVIFFLICNFFSHIENLTEITSFRSQNITTANDSHWLLVHFGKQNHLVALPFLVDLWPIDGCWILVSLICCFQFDDKHTHTKHENFHWKVRGTGGTSERTNEIYYTKLNYDPNNSRNIVFSVWKVQIKETQQFWIYYFLGFVD